MIRLNIFSWLVFSFLLFSFSSIDAQQVIPNNFEEWVEKGRKDWNVPGMAVGIVKDGEVVYAKGFGEKRLNGGEAVDVNTIFSIASVSKHITATALGILVDEGKINWNDKIVQHIPWFAMKDPWVTQEMTIKDVLTHQVGLGRVLGNRLHFMTNQSRDSLLYFMRYMDLEKPFRADFVYNNVMYSLAGQIIEYVDGRTWDEFLQDRLFKPLGMHATTTSIKELKPTDNLAYPHQEIDGELMQIERRNWDNAGPAAGVNTNINDLNKWMMMQLGKGGEPGTYQGKEIVSAKQMKQIQSAQKIEAAGGRNYGLGWNIVDYRGMQVLTHGGATDGFITSMYLVPSLNMGIVVLTNTFNSFGTALTYQVLDHYLGVEEKDWHEHYFELYQENYKKTMEAREAIHDARAKKTKPSLKLEEYVGVYYSQAYGKVEIKKVGKDLVMYFWDTEGLEAKLEHWHYDTFRAVWKNRAQREEFMQFQLGMNGKVEALNFEFVLRPKLLQVGAYPSDYTHVERFIKR